MKNKAVADTVMIRTPSCLLVVTVREEEHMNTSLSTASSEGGNTLHTQHAGN